MIQVRPILLDTDVLVDFLRGHPKAIDFVHAHADQILLSSIVIAELYAGVKGDDERSVLDQFVSLFRVLPVNAEIAKMGGLFKRQYGKSHGVGLADAIVAASTTVMDATLKTLNVKHYPMLKGLTAAYSK